MNRESGYTLIELLIALAIVGVAAVLLAALGAAGYLVWRFLA